MNMDDGRHDLGVEAEVEKWLDEGIAHYAKAEPRSGLEGRVLARITEAWQEAQEVSSGGLRWWGGLAFGIAAALLVALVLLGRVDRRTNPQTPVAKLTVTPQGGESVANGAGQKTVSSKLTSSNSGAYKLASGNSERGKREGDGQSNSTPKLEQFPSAAPLSDQERMLALYVTRFPDRATLMARAQTELHEQDEREMAAPWPAKAGGSEQPE
jgi:hypothetical protein